ncbi:GlcNAc-PI de-N-acetylase [Lentzea sp. NBRC 105346]|uniref:PIG-L deacetylase family protein n=1 Tax=Lentzea sp. NBRC 105346 TaxID=3032205 RepID=UPI0024A5504E|nr:PIG-L deacetylase family protein [Lentzea sp. NBRC 105346]GLZ31234.1 GlcNAc-PI de-N-acetylase [Lentzea sp. NBRC 105346]
MRALVVVAHPDDAEFCAAGTIGRWTDGGAEVVYCVITDGAAGGAASVRRAEQRAAAKVTGVGDVRFLGYPDGELEVSGALRQDLSRVIRELRPDRVVMHSPEINWSRLPDAHPDHRSAGETTLRAIYPDARNPLLHNDPWTVPETWLIMSPRPDHFVDITDVFDRKILALEEHRSQVGPGVRELVRGWMAEHARQAGLPDGRLAEAFQVVRTA